MVGAVQEAHADVPVGLPAVPVGRRVDLPVLVPRAVRDDPLFGRVQPPQRSSETQRHQQAAIVNRFVGVLLAADKNARVVVFGDLNDFEFSRTLENLEGEERFNLAETLPDPERYSYVFEGNSQVLDQILVSRSLLAPRPEYGSVHTNSEFADQVSDHDPQLARLRVTGEPAG